MIQRIKLMRMKTNIHVHELYKYFSTITFTQNSSFGFLNQNFDLELNSIRSTYVERDISNQEFIDPFGRAYTQTLISYNSFNFKIEPMFDGIFLLSIISPPRTIKNFIRIISEFFECQLSFSSVELSIIDLVDILTSNKKVSLFKISKLKACGIRLNESSTANIEISSKSNAIDDIKDYIKDTEYRIEKLSGSMMFNNQKMIFEINKNGLISISNNFPYRFILQSIKK
ncbi:hypothetical protein ACK33V_02345 [Aeromonas veronii]